MEERIGTWCSISWRPWRQPVPSTAWRWCHTDPVIYHRHHDCCPERSRPSLAQTRSYFGGCSRSTGDCPGSGQLKVRTSDHGHASDEGGTRDGCGWNSCHGDLTSDNDHALQCKNQGLKNLVFGGKFLRFLRVFKLFKLINGNFWRWRNTRRMWLKFLS